MPSKSDILLFNLSADGGYHDALQFQAMFFPEEKQIQGRLNISNVFDVSRYLDGANSLDNKQIIDLFDEEHVSSKPCMDVNNTGLPHAYAFCRK